MKDTRKFNGKTFKLKHEVPRQKFGWADLEANKIRKRGYCVRLIVDHKRFRGKTRVGIYTRKKRGGKC